MTDTPTSSTDGILPPDDRFIPVRREDLLDAIVADTQRFGDVAGEMREVVAAIERVIEQEAAAFHRSIDRHYAVFNPDRETLPQRDVDRLRSPDSYAGFRRRLDYLVTKANFVKLSHVEIDAAIMTANTQGIRIRLRPERVDHLDLYVRGHATIQRSFRTWRRPFKGVLRDIEVYRRMVVVVQLADSPFVILKLFREIPLADLEALLPHAEIRMSNFDRLKIIGGGAGAVGGVATKLTWALIGGAVATSQLLWPVVIAAGALSCRTIFGYRRARIFRDGQRTRHLYNQNLANNAGVLHTLNDLITQEECKEAMLAYAFCRGREPVRDADGLFDRVNAWVRQRFGVAIRFDTPDALETMDRLDLWGDRDRLTPIAGDEAIRRLDAHWSARRTAGYHYHMADMCEGGRSGDGVVITTPLTRGTAAGRSQQRS